MPENSLLTAQKAGELISAVSGNEVNNQLKEIWNSVEGSEFNPNHILTRRELAMIVDSLLQPFETKSIGFDGNYTELKDQFTEALHQN
jgi:hypothetical protein